MADIFKKSCAVFVSAAKSFPAFFGMGFPHYTVMKDLSYGSSAAQTADLYLPKSKRSKCTAIVVYIHGGGWTGGDKADCESYCRETAGRGYAAASINYRMLGDGAAWADMMDDITAALELVIKTAAESGITLKKAGLAGGSAGAHLAMLYAFKNQYTSPIELAICVSQCGPSNFTDIRLYEDGEDPAGKYALISALINRKIDKNTLRDFTAELQAVSPVTYITKNSPPTIVIQGQKDETVRYSQGVDVFDAFYTAGGVCELILFPNSGHSLSGDPGCKKRYDKLFMEFELKYFGY